MDAIYPRWDIFLRPNGEASNKKEERMNDVQKSARKDVERMFGCIQARFQIMKSRIFEWNDTEIIKFGHVCVILHNILVAFRIEGELEDETDDNGNLLGGEGVIAEFAGIGTSTESDFSSTPESHHGNNEEWASWIDTLLGIDNSIRNVHEYNKLCGALTDHIWNATGKDSGLIN